MNDELKTRINQDRVNAWIKAFHDPFDDLQSLPEDGKTYSAIHELKLCLETLSLVESQAALKQPLKDDIHRVIEKTIIRICRSELKTVPTSPPWIEHTVIPKPEGGLDLKPKPKLSHNSDLTPKPSPEPNPSLDLQAKQTGVDETVKEKSTFVQKYF